MPSPPDFYGMLQHAVKQDAHQVILAVLQRPLFAQAVIGLCNTAAAFSSTPADCARYLGSIGWTFANQADFPLLANQKGLYDTLYSTLDILNRKAASLSATLDVLNHKAAADSTAINLFFVFADAIIKANNNCHELQHQCEAAAVSLSILLSINIFS
ncbi:hypothetical protein J132_05991 [Termitomyces sp. J132]|nr:hypothetical protein J132_05991 [Termitomyces sp. J132]